MSNHAPVFTTSEEDFNLTELSNTTGSSTPDHVNGTFNFKDSDKTDTRTEDREKYGKPIEHPMVRTHPVHGSRAVYFHISKTTHISGMAAEASRAYMADLLERMIRPEIVYHHAWRKGDVLVIDDRATMHRAHGDYDRQQSRVLWRIIVEGDRPRLDRPRPV